MTQQYKYVKPWVHPDSYMGESWYDWHTSIARTRDSSLLDESNYEVFVSAIKALEEAIK